VFHSSGSALARVANEQGGLPMTVQAFASPNVYLPAVDSGQIAFGVSNVGDVRLAAVGEMHFEGRELHNLRAVAVMFPLPMAIYVREDSPIRTVEDLRGRRMPTGFAGQKTLRPLFDAMLAAGGLTTADIDQIQVPDVVGGANAFIEGKADAFFFALGAAKVREADAAVGGVRAISLPNTPEALAAVQAHWPVGYLMAAGPGPASPGVLEPIHTLTHDAIVVASTHTADEDVYALAQTLHDERAALQATFAPFARLDPDRMMVEVQGVEWHPGALAYYRDIGQIAAAEPDRPTR
jgi:TRAP transporter TAXI family solute receptor